MTSKSDEGTDPRLAAMRQAYALKASPRTGWLRVGIHDPESVADHSWGTALLVLEFAAHAGVELERAVSMALVHDLPEALTGDIPYSAAGAAGAADAARYEQKSIRERAAMRRLSTAEGHLQELWEEYEAAVSNTARFVRDMNLIDMCLQALLYAERAVDDPRAHAAEVSKVAEFFTSTESRLSSDLGMELFRELRAAYDELGGNAWHSS